MLIHIIFVMMNHALTHITMFVIAITIDIYILQISISSKRKEYLEVQNKESYGMLFELGSNFV